MANMANGKFSFRDGIWDWGLRIWDPDLRPSLIAVRVGFC